MQDLLEKFRTINCPIKSLLLDQNKVFCGIGNWLADEILYQAGIHPDTVVSRLNEKGVESLRTSMQYVLQTAISLQAQSELFPKNWLFHYRWSKGKTKNTDTVAEFGTKNIFSCSIVYCGITGLEIRLFISVLGHRIVFETVAGRTSAIVPSVQKKNGGEFCRSECDSSEATERVKQNRKKLKK